MITSVILLLLVAQLKASSESLGNTGVLLTPIENSYYHESNFILPILIDAPDLIPFPIRNFSYLNSDNLNYASTKIDHYSRIYSSPVKTFLGNYRQRRFIQSVAAPAIGWLIQKIPDLYIAIKTSQLSDQVHDLSRMMDILKKSLHDQGNSLEGLISKTEKYTNWSNQRFLQVSDELLQISSLLSKMQIDQVIQEYYQIHSYEYTRNLLKYNELKGYCRQNLIHPDLITEEHLLNLVTQSSAHIDSMGYKLSIPADQLSWLYEFRIAHCSSTKNGLMMLISLPLVGKAFNMKSIKSVTYLPIRLNGVNYELGKNDRSLLIETDQTIFSVEAFLSDCLAEEDEILESCLIKPTKIQPLPETSCLKTVWKGSTIQEYKHNCKISPLASQSNIITQVNSTTWHYSGSTVDMRKICPSSEEISVLGGDNIQNLVTLECGCTIEIGDDRLSASITSCSSLTKTVIMNLYSIYQLTYQNLYLGDQLLQTPFEINLKALEILTDDQVVDYSSEYLLARKSTHRILTESFSDSLEQPFSWALYLILSGAVMVLIIICSLFLSRKFLYASLLSSVPNVCASPMNYIELGTDTIGLTILLISIFFIYRELKKLSMRLTCHHHSTADTNGLIGRHVDLVICTSPSPTIISILDLGANGGLFVAPFSLGKASIVKGLLTVSSMEPLIGVHVSDISVNGIYSIDSNLVIPETGAFIRIPTV